MNMNPIKTIYKFNQEAGLIEKGYDDFLESSFQIEEALEGFPNLEYLWNTVAYNDIKYDDNQVTAKHISRQITTIAERGCHSCEESYTISDVDRLDKALDAIVFAFGSIFKLGLTPQQSMKALQIVMDANMSKLSAGKDEHGKQLKPKDWERHAPEKDLQKILDQRKHSGD